jgi:hypothetical protein
VRIRKAMTSSPWPLLMHSIFMTDITDMTDVTDQT